MRAAFAGQIDDNRLRTMVYTIQVALSNLPNLEPPGTRPPR